MFLIVVFACSTKHQVIENHEPKRRSVTDDNVAVPAGWFSAGCYRAIGLDQPSSDPASDAFDEHMRMRGCVRSPPRRLWVSSFEIARFETTNEQYDRCLRAGACLEQSADFNYRRDQPRYGDDLSQFPAFVHFRAARTYCEWLGMRLPTEAEWEKSARGTDDRIFTWGDSRPSCSQVTRIDKEVHNLQLKCGDQGLREIGKLPAGASVYGIQDLEDNAPEWTNDWFHPVARHVDGLRYTREHRGDYVILDLDWSSVKYAWEDPTVVDPQGQPREDPMKGYLTAAHIAKGGFATPGITQSLVGEFAGFTEADEDPVAGFRCVRTIAGPAPPVVMAPPAHTLAPPYQERGYRPPTGDPAK